MSGSIFAMVRRRVAPALGFPVPAASPPADGSTALEPMPVFKFVGCESTVTPRLQLILSVEHHLLARLQA